MKTSRKALTLLELLCVIAILSLLATLALPAVVRAQRHAKLLLIGVDVYHRAQLNAYLNDKSSDKTLLFYSTNKPKPWVIVTQPR